MANRLKMVMIETILRLHQRGWSNRRIARELGIDRGTVARRIRTFKAPSNTATLLIGSEPIGAGSNAATPLIGSVEPTGASELVSGTALVRSGGSACEPWRALILAKLEQGLSAQRIYQDLLSEHGFNARYHSVQRFVRRLGSGRALPFRRLECAPGEEAQVDFGSGIPILQADGKRRRTHVFRIVLSYSRKGYSEAVYRQTTEAFIACLENAFAHFGGVPKTLVLDNLKAGVEKPDWFDPELNPKLRSFADHYGVAILPTRPRLARHKGKIESGVGYVKNNALKGHVFHSLEEENRHLLSWESSVADVRIHGTIRQQVIKVFTEVERPVLLPLPLERFPFFHEGQRRVQRDGYVEVDKAYYSVPPEYLGQVIWVRWDTRTVRVFNNRFESITLHVKRHPGRFSTHNEHIPAEKVSAIERGAGWLLGKVRRVGCQSRRWAEGVLETRGIEGLRVVQGLLSLSKRHSSGILEKACEIAVSHGCYRLRTIRELLKRQEAKQELLPFMEEHPIIRSLSDYAQVLHTGLEKESPP
jgi:transposase